MIINDFITYTKDYRGKYGDKCVCTIQVGDFFEFWDYPGAIDAPGPGIHAIADICNIQVTRKNKSILEVSRNNPWMAGFPMHALSKHSKLLVEAGFTLVIVRQTTPPPNPVRKVTEVLSPATVLTVASETSWLMVYYFEADDAAAGIAGVDVTTGKTFFYECTEAVADESYRLLNHYQPSEIVVYGPAKEMFEGRNVHFKSEIEPGYNKLKVQNMIIAKAFPTTDSIQTPIEVIGAERYDLARIAFVMALQFAYDHNENIIKSLDFPEVLTRRGILSIEYNSAQQLNLIGCNNGKGLIDLLNRCGTAFGRRLFKDRLLTPIVHRKTLNARYQKIEEYKPRARELHKILSQIPDLERILRKIALGTFAPMEWPSLIDAFAAAKEVLGQESTVFAKAAAYATDRIDLTECSRYNLTDIRGNIFHSGIYKDIDAECAGIIESREFLENKAVEITKVSGGDATLCKVEHNDRDGYYLLMTKRRWEKALALGWARKMIEARPVSTGSTSVRLSSPELSAASDRIILGEQKIGVLVTARYREFLTEFDNEYHDNLLDAIYELANVDVTVNNARNALDYDYRRPTLESGAASTVRATGLRHPIIERIQTSVDYITNDIELGAMLLYGLNAAGKSSLMKAIGLNVIMAQAGMYVAADSLTLKPFTSIFTRISGADNIYRGMSSFTVEMTELRTILQRANARSLVLGDELCAGTEAVSAISIVAAGINHFIKGGIPFMFATHLHELTELDSIKAASQLQIAHLHVETTDGIVYDRKLRPGSGNPLYGLEVCAALRLPAEFIAAAQKIRRKIQAVPDKIIDASRMSRYNSEVIMDKCGVCGTSATETHHIRYQSEAREDWVENGVHKNRASNLVPLCEACHQKEHKGKIKIKGYQHTNDGRKLLWSEVNTAAMTK